MQRQRHLRITCARALRGLAVALLVSVATCGKTNDSAANEGNEAAKAKSPDSDKAQLLQERTRTHTEALGRATELAEPLLVRADPIAAWESGRGPLAPRPTAAPSLKTLRPDQLRLQRELQGIDIDVLSPVDQVRLHALSLASHRLEEHAIDYPLGRRDPTVGPAATRALLDRVELGLREGSLDDPTAVLQAQRVELEAIAKDLGAASPASMDAAIRDYAALRSRVATLARLHPEVDEGWKTLSEQLEQNERTVSAQRKAMAAEPTAGWNDAVVRADGAPSIATLPEVLGRSTLQRRLEVEEGINRPLAEALPQLIEMMKRVDALLASQNLEASNEAMSAAPPDVERCEAMAKQLAAWHEARAHDARPLDCETFVATHPEPVHAGELWEQLVRRTWLAARARKHRKAAPPWGALVSGDMAPASAALLGSLAAAAGSEDPKRIAPAALRTKAAICQAGAALWLHAELGPRDKLQTWLSSDCPFAPPSSFIEEALARPRPSLAAMGLVLASSSARGAAMLDAVPWAPLGLVPGFADPSGRPAQGPWAEFEVLGDMWLHQGEPADATTP